jgi:hypothetical protein
MEAGIMAHETTPQTQLGEAPSGASQDLPLAVLNQIHALIAQQHDAVLDQLDRFKKRIIAALLGPVNTTKNHWCPVKYFAKSGKALIISRIASLRRKNDLN